jgi:hypothetical protein
MWTLLRLLLLALLRVVLGGCLGCILLLLPAARVAVEEGLDCLLAQSNLRGDVHQFICFAWGLAAQLANQISAGGARKECTNDVGISDVGELDALL